MGYSQLKIGGKPITLHPAVFKPELRSSRVLCSDPWDYVYLWLRRNHKEKALFYWEQSRQFYNASKLLPDLSSPLTSYYCFLNATKALLVSKNKSFREVHGVGGAYTEGQISLKNEIVKFHSSGILPEFCHYFNEPDNSGNEYTLHEILWHVPYIHRAFSLTYRSSTELYLPLIDCSFQKSDKTRKIGFQAKIDRRYVNSHTRGVIEPDYKLVKSKDENEKEESYKIRKTIRFKWRTGSIEKNISSFKKYHQEIRSKIHPIYAPENRWYLIKSVSGHDSIKNSPLVLTFAAMHKLSELSRYNPIRFNRHLKASHNWLISEFLRLSLSQFIYGISSEITGMEFLAPDAFQSTNQN